jgi:hypothetical protein
MYEVMFVPCEFFFFFPGNDVFIFIIFTVAELLLSGCQEWYH